MYKAAKCSPGILAAEPGWKALNDHLYGSVLLFPHTVSVFNLFFFMELVAPIYEIINIGVCK